jgi:hypothetical protein
VEIYKVIVDAIFNRFLHLKKLQLKTLCEFVIVKFSIIFMTLGVSKKDNVEIRICLIQTTLISAFIKGLLSHFITYGYITL